MRRLLIVVAVVLLIGGGLLIAAAVSLNRILAHNRDRILRDAEAVIGRSVAADEIVLSLWGGIGARLENVRIADDPAFGATAFLHATAVTARAHLWPLLRGQLAVGRIDMTHPEIHLIRDASGRWNYSTLKPLKPEASAATSNRPIAVVNVAAVEAAAPAAVPFLISRLTIADGTVVVTDRSQNPPRTTRIDRIDLSIDDLSMVTPIRFTLAAALQADTPNVRLRGTAGPLNERAAIRLALDGGLGPLGPQGVRLDDLHLKATVTPDSLRVSECAGHGFGGSFTVTGQYPTQREGAAALKGQLKDIAIAQVLGLTIKDAAKHITGAGQLALDLHANGNSAETIQASLAGTITAEVRDGVIEDFNLPNEVLGRVTGLPGIGDLISAEMKPKYGRLFSEPNTRFEQLHCSLRVADRRLQTDDLAIIATDYGARATGWFGFNRDADLAGTLLMSKQFSADVVADVTGAKYLVDDSGQLAIPFRLRGKLGEAKPKPDSDALLAILTRALTHGAAKDLVEQLFGGKKRTAPSGGNESRHPFEQRLRDLLGR